MNDFRDHALVGLSPSAQSRMANASSQSAALDIEELADLGRKMNCCPYYGSRRAVRQAQVSWPRSHRCIQSC